ncbi:MAG: putative outer membrane protein-like protein [Phycisphaerales bacterium]|nr:putative outer membrane protein-like protein [Phycisphaerales bacterium]
MVRNGKTLAAFTASLVLSGGMCMAQATPPAQPQQQPPAGVHQPGSAQPGAGGNQPVPPALTAEKAMAMMEPKQVDQQADMQLQKIAQSKDMAGDRLFVLEAGLNGQFEMALAQQALQKSQSPQVKQIAQRLVQDHGQANQQLTQVAQKNQVEVPMGLTGMKAQKLQIIGSMEGKEYDQAFLGCMDALHAHDVTEFRNKAQTAKNADVKQFAAMTAPKLAQHHQLIKQAAMAAGLTGGGMDAQPAAGRVEATPLPAGSR